MSVALDATGTEFTSTAANTTTFDYTGLTIGASLTNGAAIFGIWAQDAALGGTATISSVKWNAVSCTQIGTINTGANSFGGLFIYGIVNPASGNKTLELITSDNAFAGIIGVSFSGVDQTGGSTSFPNFNTLFDSVATASDTLTITTANGNYTFSTGACGSGDMVATVSPGQIFSDGTSFSGAGVIWLAADNASVAATRVYTYTNSIADVIMACGCDIKAAAAGAVVIPTESRLLLGVGM